MQCEIFCFWFLSLSIMLSRFIYVVACIGTLFLFWLKVCCMGILCFILSSIDGYLGFHFLAIMNNAAINLLCTNFCFEIYFKDLFCFWLHWVFVAVCGLCLVAVSKGHPSLGLTGFSSRWLLFEASLGLTGFLSWWLLFEASLGLTGFSSRWLLFEASLGLTGLSAGASVVAARGLSSCGPRA